MYTYGLKLYEAAQRLTYNETKKCEIIKKMFNGKNSGCFLGKTGRTQT